MNPETDIWIIFGAKQMDVFDKDNIAFCNCLVLGNGLRRSMVEVYNAIVRYKLATKIEELPIHQKEKLFIQAKEIAGNNALNKEGMIELCKALYAIECFQTK